MKSFYFPSNKTGRFVGYVVWINSRKLSKLEIQLSNLIDVSHFIRVWVHWMWRYSDMPAFLCCLFLLCQKCLNYDMIHALFCSSGILFLLYLDYCFFILIKTTEYDQRTTSLPSDFLSTSLPQWREGRVRLFFENGTPARMEHHQPAKFQHLLSMAVNQ